MKTEKGKIKSLEEIFSSQEDIKIAIQLLETVPEKLGEYPYTLNREMSIVRRVAFSNTLEEEKAKEILRKLSEKGYILCEGFMVYSPLYSKVKN